MSRCVEKVKKWILDPDLDLNQLQILFDLSIYPQYSIKTFCEILYTNFCQNSPIS